LAVHEYERYAAKGAGSDYSQGCLYGTYDLMDDAFEITRLALESACHFSIYCKEPLDIIEVRAADFGTKGGSYKQHAALKTIENRLGTRDFVAVRHDSLLLDKDFSSPVKSKMARPAAKRTTTKTSTAKSSAAKSGANRGGKASTVRRRKTR
jgi:hypothetical protein